MQHIPSEDVQMIHRVAVGRLCYSVTVCVKLAINQIHLFHCFAADHLDMHFEVFETGYLLWWNI